MPNQDEWKGALPTYDEMLEVINKPDNGLLMVELTPSEAEAVHKFIATITLASCRTDGEATGLYKILQALTIDRELI